MKNTLPRNYTSVSENLLLEIWYQLGKHFFSTRLLFHFEPDSPFIHSNIWRCPPYARLCAEQGTMSVQSSHFSREHRHGKNIHIINSFLLTIQFRISCKLIWGPKWSNLGKKGELHRVSIMQQPWGRKEQVSKVKQCARMQRGRKGASDETGKEARGQYWKDLSENEPF